MFDDHSPFEEVVKELLRLYDISDILELCDITEHRVLEILLEGGHIDVPPFLDNNKNNTYEDEIVDDDYDY